MKMEDLEINNDGYYQEHDENMSLNREFEAANHKTNRPVKTRIEASYKDEHYDEIDAKYDTSKKSGRRKFIEERADYHLTRMQKYEKDKANGTYKDLPKSQGFYQCKNCKGGFVARKADRKRGWARFCSKSCKAQY